MRRNRGERLAVLRGTLELLILRTLQLGPAHGHQIARHIQRTTNDVLQVEHGSLYPALHRLEKRGLVAAKWEGPEELVRRYRYYSLTAAGRKKLASESSKWKQFVNAIASVMQSVKSSS